MNEQHEPSAAFLDQLERHTGFLLRQRESRGAGWRDVEARWMRAVRVAALFLLAAGLGAGGALAAEHFGDLRQRDQRLERNDILTELATRRLDLARGRSERAHQLVESGMASTTSEHREIARLVQAELDLALLRLAREELMLGGTPPPELEVGALSSPLVAGRDFVSERLEVRRVAAARELELGRTSAQQAEQLFAAGMMSTSSLVPVRAKQKRLALALEGLLGRQALRARFLDGLIEPADCEREALRLTAEAEVALGTARVEAARSALELAELLHQSGHSPVPEAERLELHEAEAELALAKLGLTD